MEMDQNFTLLAHSRIESPRGSNDHYRRIELAIGRKGFVYRAIVRESWGMYQSGASDVEEGFLRATSTDSDWPLVLIGIRDKAAPRRIGFDPEAAGYLKAALAECEASLRVLTA